MTNDEIHHSARRSSHATAAAPIKPASLPSLAPILAGGILASVGAEALFITAAAIGIITLGFSFRFGDLRAADQRALRAAVGGDEKPPSPAVAEAPAAALTPKLEGPPEPTK